MLVGHIIPRNAKQSPQRTAVVCEGRSYTFAQHAERVYRLANALIDRGVRHQERISILAQNSAEYVEVYGAGEVAGFVVHTLNFRLAPEEVRYVLGDAGPAALFFDAAHLDTVALLRPELSGIREFICIGHGAGPLPSWCDSYESVLESGASEQPGQVPGLEDTAYLIYTSGTTGRPKGVMLGQRAQWLNALVIAHELNVCPTDRWLLVMPLFHVGAKYIQLAHHGCGAAIFVQRRFDPASVVSAIEQERMTRTHLAPTMLRAILDLPDIDRRDLSSLRMITYGTAPMPVPLLRRALKTFGPVFQQRYGSTEAAAVTALLQHQHVLDGPQDPTRRLASAGQPNLMTEVRVVREDGNECKPGEPGELLIRNPELIMQGYWRNPEATREALHGGWYHSGDIATLDEENFVYIVDRKQEMIISGGENIYPREVEEAILRHPAVTDTAVIGIPDDKWGETVMAFVVLRDGASLTEEDVIEFCRTRIASYKKPTRVEFHDALPRMPSGKIDKRKLRERFWKERTRQI